MITDEDDIYNETPRIGHHVSFEVKVLQNIYDVITRRNVGIIVNIDHEGQLAEVYHPEGIDGFNLTIFPLSKLRIEK